MKIEEMTCYAVDNKMFSTKVEAEAYVAMQPFWAIARSLLRLDASLGLDTPEILDLARALWNHRRELCNVLSEHYTGQPMSVMEEIVTLLRNNPKTMWSLRSVNAYMAKYLMTDNELRARIIAYPEYKVVIVKQQMMVNKYTGIEHVEHSIQEVEMLLLTE